MRKYWLVFSTTLQKETVYPWHLIFGLGQDFIMVLVYILVWGAIFKEEKIVANYSFTTIATYYILQRLFHQLTTSGRVASLLSRDIRRGELSYYLLKPLSYPKFRFAEVLGEKLVLSGPIFLLVLLGLLFSLQSILLRPKVSYLPLLITSLILGTTLNFFLYYLVGCMSFWLIRSWGIRSLIGRVIDILSGSWFPLDLLPQVLLRIVSLLPFGYLTFFPISVYLNRLTVGEIGKGLFVEVIWILGLYFLAKKLWQKGVRGYEAVGN